MPALNAQRLFAMPLLRLPLLLPLVAVVVIAIVIVTVAQPEPHGSTLLHHVEARRGRLVDAYNAEEPIVCGREFLFYRFHYMSLVATLELRARDLHALVKSIDKGVVEAASSLRMIRDSPGLPAVTSAQKWEFIIALLEADYASSMLSDSIKDKIEKVLNVARDGVNVASGLASTEILWASLGLWEEMVHCEKYKFQLYPSGVFKTVSHDNTQQEKTRTESDIDKVRDVEIRKLWDKIERKYRLMREFASVMLQYATTEEQFNYSVLELKVASQEILSPDYRPPTFKATRRPMRHQKLYMELKMACLEDSMFRSSLFGWEQSQGLEYRGEFKEHLTNFDLLVIDVSANGNGNSGDKDETVSTAK